MKTRTMAAGKFKAQCLAVMDEVQKKRQPVVVTKRGKPVVKVIPADNLEEDEIIDSWKGRIKILGDIVAPAATPEEWGEIG